MTSNKKNCTWRIGGIVGSSKIHLADNRDLTLLEIMEEYNLGKDNFCFSLDSISNIVIAKIEKPVQINNVSKLLKITLDNCDTIFCDFNFNFITRDNMIVDAGSLYNNQSLMPLVFDYAKNIPKGKEDYRRNKNLNEYLVVFNPASELYVFIHSLADNYNLRNLIYSRKKGNFRHHRDFNKYNNNPTNIDRKTRSEHLRLHSEIASENMRKLHQNPEFQERHSKRASNNISRYLNSEEFFKMTRGAGQRGKKFLIKYNTSEKGKKKSSEIGKDGRMICHICGQEFFGRKGNNQHYKEKHPEIWAQWQNNLQKASLEYVRSDEARNQLSKRVKNGEMTCHICGEIIYGANKLKKHYAEVHNDPLPCTFCGKSFKGMGGLGTHVRFCPKNPDREVREVGSFPCRFCDKVFGSQRGLSGHITRGHRIINHKIIDIEIIECEPIAIYNLCIKNFDNFGLSAGIFAHI
jgi:DNA gyrase subunit B